MSAVPLKSSFRHPSLVIDSNLTKKFLLTELARYLWIVLAIGGSILFGIGFLAIRSTPDIKNSCAILPIDPVLLQKSTYSNGCWLPISKKPKIILILIDALRTDFVLPNLANHNKSISYLNKLTVLHELCANEPQYARLFRFIADPPTATAQRLQALTAGTLPVFIEVTANFNSQAYSADNIIYQLLHNGKESYSRLHMLGDDTWLNLYPYINSVSTGTVSGYHSFHLFDLHSVDNGVTSQLFPILQSNNFDVIIAHFLGLDHCGHKYGPNHVHCGEKLSELDQIIRKVVATIDEDTTLFVFGDHGMTEEGDHGGSTPLEVSSALFFYRKAGFLPIISGAEFEAAQKNENTHWNGFFNRVRLAKDSQFPLDQLNFYSGYANSTVLSGTINQIGLVPSISLMAGIPIPFGNLGLLIPDLLFDNEPYRKVMEYCKANSCTEGRLSFLLQLSRLYNYRRMIEGIRLNTKQILKYFDSLHKDSNFRSDSVRPFKLEFNTCEVALQFAANSYISLLELDLDQLVSKNNDAILDSLAEKYNTPLLLLNLSLDDLYLRYSQLSISCLSYCRSVWASFNYPLIILGIALVSLACILSSVSFISPFGPIQLYVDMFPALLMYSVHAVGFATTSFLKFEQSIVYFLLLSLVLYQIYLRIGLMDGADMIRSLALILLLGLLGRFGVCREEQYPYCKLWHHRLIPAIPGFEFFAAIALGIVGIIGIAIWNLTSFQATTWKHYIQKGLFSVNLILITVHWMLTWLSDTSDIFKNIAEDYGSSGTLLLTILPILLLILSVSSIILGLFHNNKDTKQSTIAIQVSLGVAFLVGMLLRPFGSWLIVCLGCPILFFGFKLFKSDSLLLALFVHVFGLALFFGTGHQATISSIQWEAAFIGAHTSHSQLVSFIILVLNTFAGPLLATVFVTLIDPTAANILLTLTAWEMLFSILFIPFLLDHLMIWQIFTPRFLMQLLLLLATFAANTLFRLFS